MALTLTDFNAYTTQMIVPKITDVIYKNDPLLARLQSRNRMRFSGGQYIQRPLMYQKLNGGAFSRGSNFNIDYVQAETALTAYMKFYYVAVTLLGVDDVLNAGPVAAFSQASVRMDNAAMRMSELLSTDLYKDGTSTQGAVEASGDLLSTSTAFTGLLAWIDDGNSGSGYPSATDLTRSFPTVGGISRSDLATVPSSGAITPISSVVGMNAYVNRDFDVFTLPQVQKAWAATHFGNDSVDLMLSNTSGYDNFWNATQPLQRYAGDGGSASDLAKVGLRAFRYQGAEIAVSRYMPYGMMLGLNTEYLEFYVTTNPKFQYGFTGFKEAQNTIDLAGQFPVCGGTDGSESAHLLQADRRRVRCYN
ncbi:MAG: phage major capsid protein [Candidatus Competibacteraceae bacterium]|nr:phage major capsid protein [Candidatus Competibacteraceae bacterium]